MAVALEPHIFKETAFSDTKHPQKDTLDDNLKNIGTEAMKFRSSRLTREPSVQTNVLAEEEMDKVEYVETKRSPPPRKEVMKEPPRASIAFSSNLPQDELFLMDSYYKELIKKERAAFERVLASKVNIA